jgi:hypothetical protein
MHVARGLSVGLVLVEEMRAFDDNNRVFEDFGDFGKDSIRRIAQENKFRHSNFFGNLDPFLSQFANILA